MHGACSACGISNAHGCDFKLLYGQASTSSFGGGLEIVACASNSNRSYCTIARAPPSNRSLHPYYCHVTFDTLPSQHTATVTSSLSPPGKKCYDLDMSKCEKQADLACSWDSGKCQPKKEGLRAPSTRPTYCSKNTFLITTRPKMLRS